MKKRFVSLALALVMALSLLPTATFATEGDFTIDADGKLTEYNGLGGDVVIPDGVTAIGDRVFYGCSELTSVTIPNSTTKIFTSAFNRCSGLTSVTIPDSVTVIGAWSFVRCNSLRSVTIPGSVTFLGGSAFSNCENLTSVTILGPVTELDHQTFYNCASLSSLVLPDSVTGIGKDVFHGCAGLTDIYYSGSEDQWKNIVINSGNEELSHATIHYNSTVSSTAQSTPTQDAASMTAYASTQNVLVDGESVEFQCYALKDEKGNDTNYIKLRDVASVLNGSSAQFNVGWNGSVNIETGKAYVPNGSEWFTPFDGDRTYENATATTNINGKAANLSAILLKDDTGSGFTYYKLRDLGSALGFTVDWSTEKGIFIETK